MCSHRFIYRFKHSGMARVNEGSHSFICHPHVYPQVEWTIPAITPLLQCVTARWPVLISRPAEGRRLSWEVEWSGAVLCSIICTSWRRRMTAVTSTTAIRACVKRSPATRSHCWPSLLTRSRTTGTACNSWVRHICTSTCDECLVTGIWIGFCLTRPISLCLDSFLCMYVNVCIFCMTVYCMNV